MIPPKLPPEPSDVANTPLPRRRNRHRVVARILLVASGALLALVLGEVTLRLQEPFFHFMQARARTSEFLMIPHPIWHHWPRPNSTLTFGAHDPIAYPRPVIYTTDSKGCRSSRKVRVPKPDGIWRIVILGDSFMAGYYEEDTVAVHLERRLYESFPGRSFEVINCASTSYSPLLEFLRLKHQLVALEPNEIILDIDLTDVFDDYWLYRPLATWSPDGAPMAVRGETGWLRRLLLWLRFHFYLPRLVSEVRARVRSIGETEEGRRDRTSYVLENVLAYHSTLPVESETWQEEVGFCLSNISRILEFCRSRGINVVVTIHPYRQQIRPRRGEGHWHREFERRVEKLCAEGGVDFLSTFEGIARAERAGPSLYWSDDIHFTPDGQRLWAGLISDYYVARLPRRSGRTGPPDQGVDP